MKIKTCVSVFLLLTTLAVFSQDNLYSALTIPKELKENANAVIRANKYQIIIESQQKMIITLNRVVTVLNEKGNVYPQAFVGYDNFRKVKKIEAKVYDENGLELKKYKKNDFIDQSAVDGGTLYSDSRVLFMGYTPTNYPYTVQFKYELETPNTAGIATWSPIIGYFSSIEKDTYTIVDNANLGLRFKEKNFDSYNIQTNKTERSTTYSLQNIAAIKPEDLSPSLREVTPTAMIASRLFHYNGVDGYASNWVEFGDWMIKSLLEGRNQLTIKTKNEVLKLVKGVNDPIEKAKKIYEYVQNSTRYISVQVGIGGIQPINSLEVDKLKYGDCKGLTNYTQALLNIVGVQSYYTVVEAGRHIEDFEDDFASLEQGNHIILAIPNNDDFIWLDCTSQLQPFGFIGDFTDSRNVLLVKEGESKIVKTPDYINDGNEQIINTKIKLNTDGSIRSQIKIISKGIQYDNRFYIEEKDHKDILEFYMNYWSEINNLKIESYKFNNDKSNVEFNEEISLSAKKYAVINNSNLIFAINMFNKNTFIPKRYRNRKLPLKIQRGYLDEDNFTIEIPDGYTVEVLPQKVEIKNKFGEYFVDYVLKESTIFYTRKLLIKKGLYEKLDYELYRKFRRKVAKQDKILVILNKK